MLALEPLKCLMMGPACLDVLRLFVLGKNDVVCLTLVKVCIYIGNARVRLLKGIIKGPTRRTQGCRDTALVVSIDDPNDARLVGQWTFGGISSMET